MEVLANMDRYALRLLWRLPTRYFRFRSQVLGGEFRASDRLVGCGHGVLGGVLSAVADPRYRLDNRRGGASFGPRALVKQSDTMLKSRLLELVGVDVATQYANPAFEQVFNQGLRGLGIVGYLVAFYGEPSGPQLHHGIRMVSGGGADRARFGQGCGHSCCTSWGSCSSFLR